MRIRTDGTYMRILKYNYLKPPISLSLICARTILNGFSMRKQQQNTKGGRSQTSFYENDIQDQKHNIGPVIFFLREAITKEENIK